jgi:hypothetical protein
MDNVPAKLKAIVETCESPHLSCIWFYLKGVAEFASPLNGDAVFRPIGMFMESSDWYRANDDVYHYVVEGYSGGYIYFGKSYEECLNFCTKMMRRTLKQIVEE